MCDDLFLHSASVAGSNLFGLERYHGQDDFLHRDAAVLKTVAILVEIFMIVRRVDEVVVFFRDDVIDRYPPLRKFIILRVLYENSLPVIRLEIAAKFISEIC